MKQSILCLSLYILTSLYHKHAIGETFAAGDNNTTTTSVSANEADAYIAATYAQIDFGKHGKLDEQIFRKAMTGYLNLKNAGKLNGRQLLTVADFTKSSTQNRLWIIDLEKKKVVYNTYVAHGQGSGMDYATEFSNTDGTHASSLGFFVTGDTYTGQHGNSLRLNGMDNGWNNNALSRGIVVHAADYVSSSTIAGQGRLGRSWGCPAVAPELAQPIINLIKGGTCLFIYAAQKDYLKASYWANKKIERVPGTPANFQPVTDAPKIAQIAAKIPAPKVVLEVPVPATPTTDTVFMGGRKFSQL